MPLLELAALANKTHMDTPHHLHHHTTTTTTSPQVFFLPRGPAFVQYSHANAVVAQTNLPPCQVPSPTPSLPLPSWHTHTCTSTNTRRQAAAGLCACRELERQAARESWLAFVRLFCTQPTSPTPTLPYPSSIHPFLPTPLNTHRIPSSS